MTPLPDTPQRARLVRRGARLLQPPLLALMLCIAKSAHAEATSVPAPPVSAATSPTPSPRNDAAREAGDHYNRGLERYSDDEFALAAIEFDRAYALVSDYRVLYNIGQVRIQLGNYAKAKVALEHYLSGGADKIAPERRKAVADDLDMLSSRTATLRVETNVTGAVVLIDDIQVGTSPIADSVLLDAGDHRLTLRKPGFISNDARLTLAGGDATATRLDLIAEPQAQASRVVVERRFVEKSDHTTWVWFASATGAFAVGAAIVGAEGLKSANQLDALRNDPNASRGELDSTQGRARTLLVTGDLLGGAAIVSGAFGLYFYLKSRGDSGHETAAHRQAVPVDVALGPSWIGLRGTY